MINSNFFCLIIILLLSISNSNAQVLKINIENQHPVLVDHHRILTAYDDNGIAVDSLKISPCTGAQTNTSIYDEGENYIIIDVNGIWVYLNKKNRKFCKGAWKWNHPLPKQYIGTFQYRSEANDYIIVDKNLQEKDIYLIKDPTDYSQRFLKEESIELLEIMPITETEERNPSK